MMIQDGSFAVFNWKHDVDWGARVQQVRAYYAGRPHLRYGPAKEEKAFSLIDDLCSNAKLCRSEVMNKHALTEDGVMTILSNVTMAVQGKTAGPVWSPETGGWYVAIDSPEYTYFVAPGFSAAWNSNKKATGMG